MPDLDDLAIEAESAIESIGSALEVEEYLEYLKNVEFYLKGLIAAAREDVRS